ncbi:MAG: hypothetical protein R3336_07200, partial [Phycisphaeraceae bacterium]|nr:hypothetical protein [Phycisphaeraceae bacterium]
MADPTEEAIPDPAENDAASSAEPESDPREKPAESSGGDGEPTTVTDVSELKGRRIGRILTKMGIINRQQVQEALQMQSQRKQPLGQLLIELGYVEEQDVNAALAAQAGMETLDITSREIPPEAIDALPGETAEAYQIVPLAFDEASKTLTIAMKSADNFRAIDDLQLLMGYSVKPVIAPPDQIEAV